LEKFHPCSEGMQDNATLFVIKQFLLRRFRHDDVFWRRLLNSKNAVLSKLASNSWEIHFMSQSVKLQLPIY